MKKYESSLCALCSEPPPEASPSIARVSRKSGEKRQSQGRVAARRALPLTLPVAPGKTAGAMGGEAATSFRAVSFSPAR